MNNLNLWWRLRICYLMSALNLSFMLLPNIRQTYYLIFLVVLFIFNLASFWLVLSGVQPSRGADDHQRLVAFSKKWMLILGISSAVGALVLALMGELGRRDIPFLICGYAFFLVVSKVLEISIEKRMSELRNNI